MSKHAVFGFGRMNPITSGHSLVVDMIKKTAKKKAATPLLFLTHSQDPKKNPLQYNDKVDLARKAFGNLVQKSKSKTIIQVLQELDNKYDSVTLVVGADRVDEFDRMMKKYNGKEYNFDSVEVVSAGNRADPDSDKAQDMSAENMSASIMRNYAVKGDLESFTKGLPSKLKKDAKKVFDLVRTGMKLELDEAILNVAQRRKRGLLMRRYKSKIAVARKKNMRRKASTEKLMKRSQKKAIQSVRDKVSSGKNKRYADMSPGEKSIIDRKVQKRSGLVKRMAKKLLPKVKKAEIERVAKMRKSTNEEFKVFMDSKSYPVTIPKSIATEIVALEVDTLDNNSPKEKRTFVKEFKAGKGKASVKVNFSEEGFDYFVDKALANIYEIAKSNIDKRLMNTLTKFAQKVQDQLDESTVTNKDFQVIFAKQPKSEDELPINKPKKRRFHQMYNKEGAMKYDKRFRAFRHMKKEEVETDEQIVEAIDRVANEISEEIFIAEMKIHASLVEKAEKSDIPYYIINEVYNRGVATYVEEDTHTPQQIGFARVNSYINGGSIDDDLLENHLVNEMFEIMMEKKDVKLPPHLAKFVGKDGDWTPEVKKRLKGTSLEKLGKKKKSKDVTPKGYGPDVNEAFEIMLEFSDEAYRDKQKGRMLDSILKHMKQQHTTTKKSIDDIAFAVTRSHNIKDLGMNARSLVAKYREKYPEKKKQHSVKVMHKFRKHYNMHEEGGAGEMGTKELSKKYAEDTPGQSVKDLDDGKKVCK